MGKIVKMQEVKRRKSKEETGIECYYLFYKEFSGRLKETILNQIARDMGCKSCYDRDFIKTIEPQEALELIGYASAKYIRKDTKTTANYYKKLYKIISNYGLEVLKNAKIN